MPEKNVKSLVIPLIAISIFSLALFASGYAYFNGTTTMKSANYQVNMPKQTSLICTKTDCSLAVTNPMMQNTNTSSTAKISNTCSVNCTCSGSEGATCNYSVRLAELGSSYTPSSGLGSNKEFTAKVTSPTGCTAQNSSSTETQVNTIRDKIVSNCTLTVPASGSVSANVTAEFKWYNLNLDQNAHASKHYSYVLTNDNTAYTVTLDPNGGSVSQNTIQVTYGEVYGNIPQPTWAGHTFRGWHGINIFNPDTMPITNTGHTQGTEEIQFYEKVYDRIMNKSVWVPNPNTYYTIVMEVLENTFDQSMYLYTDNRFYVETITNAYYYPGVIGKHVLTFKTRSDYSTVTIGSLWFHSSNTIIGTMVGKMAIYEGTDYTEYEPYYITSNTRVVRAENHTLTAIWD